MKQKTNGNPMAGMTGFRRDLLFAVATTTEAHGLRLKEKLESDGYSPINHGRLYQNLGELVDTGLVRKEPVDGRTNHYKLTPVGEIVVDGYVDWVNQVRL